MSYLKFSLDDYVNAGLYGYQFVKKYRFDTQQTETRWSLPPYTISEQPYDKEEFYLPAELQSEFKTYDFHFPANSCAEMSCFFNISHDKLCPKRLEDRTYSALKMGDDLYRVCQDGCYRNKFSDSPFVCETYYEKGKCFMRNVGFKHYCIFPRSRNENIPNLPPFTYNEQTGDCHFNKEYCKFFATEFDSQKRECYVPDGQRYVEQYLTGQTIYRLFKILSDKKSSRMETNDESAIENIIYSLLHDAGIDTTLVLSKHLTLKTIPLLNSNVSKLLISQFQSRFGLAIARASAVSLVLESTRHALASRMALRVSRAISGTSTVAGFVLLYFAVVGLILDAVDPLSLKAQLTPGYMKKLKFGFEHLFAKEFNQNTECKPEFFISVFSEGLFNQAENLIYMKHMCIYLQKLQFNADGLKIIQDSETGLSVEQTIARILRATSQLDDDQSLKPKMDNMFSKFAIFISLLIPLFLAVSI